MTPHLARGRIVEILSHPPSVLAAMEHAMREKHALVAAEIVDVRQDNHVREIVAPQFKCALLTHSATIIMDAR